MTSFRDQVLNSGRLPARALRIGWAALQRYLAAGGMRQGAAVAFYAAFSIAPLLVVVTGVMVWLLGSDAAQAALLDAVQRLIGANETQTLSELLRQREVAAVGSQPAAFGSWLALGTTLIGATGVFIELRAALQAMLGENDGAFSWWQLVRVRLLAIGVVLGCGFLLSVAMLAQTVSLLALRWASGRWPLLAPLLGTVEALWSWAVITLLFALMIRWLPTGRLPMRHALAGAAVAGALFMVGRYGISLYIATTATRSALGAAGSFAALLVWVYWSSQIFLLGGALAVEIGAPNAVAADTTPGRVQRPVTS
ncbi:MAG: YihY/virulence factor BrkB family protein [Pseudomonadota bacterium]|nr:YihY/virulence factor BrkB family protein [Pseudomonadota bacterium]